MNITKLKYKIKKGLYITTLLASLLGGATLCAREPKAPSYKQYELTSRLIYINQVVDSATNKTYALNKTKRNRLEKLIEEKKEVLKNPRYKLEKEYINAEIEKNTTKNCLGKLGGLALLILSGITYYKTYKFDEEHERKMSYDPEYKKRYGEKK